MVVSLIQTAEWLAKMESLALDCYQKVQAIPGFSPGFVEFLAGCAEEEAWHLKAINKAARLLEEEGDVASDLEIDSKTSERVESLFQKVLERSGGERVTEHEVMECIATTEFSEWNSIFIYFMRRLTEISGKYLYSAARIQNHLQKIIDYFDLTGFEDEKLKRLKSLPRVWEESILVVDDEMSIRELLAGMLQTRGRVSQAQDGLEALGLLRNHYYKVIISDLEMPRLDGLGFFRKALEIHPRIAERFIFLSANTALLTPDIPGIGEASVLKKPFRAWDLIERVKALLEKE